MDSRTISQELIEEAGSWAGLIALAIEFEDTHEPGDEISQEEADIFIENVKKIMDQEEKSFPKNAATNDILAKSLMSYLIGRTIKPKSLEPISSEQTNMLLSEVSQVLEKFDIPSEKHNDFCITWIGELNKHFDFINALTVKEFNQITKPFASQAAIKLLGYTETSSQGAELNERLQKIPFITKLMNQAMDKILEIALKKEKIESNFERLRNEELGHFSTFVNKSKKEEVLPPALSLAL